MLFNVITKPFDKVTQQKSISKEDFLVSIIDEIACRCLFACMRSFIRELDKIPNDSGHFFREDCRYVFFFAISDRSVALAE